MLRKLLALLVISVILQTFLVSAVSFNNEQLEVLFFGEVIEGGDSRYLFTGKEKDRETGLQYYNARYYAPDQARFIQPDSVQPNVYDPQQLNKYSYARNNPVKYTDPSGNVPIDTLGDIGFMIWDVYVIATKGSGKGGENWKTLGMDTVGLFVPYATGLGKAYKAGKAAKIVDKVGDVGKVVDKGTDLNKATKASDALKAAKVVDTAVTVKYGDKTVPIFRGGSDFTIKPGEIKIDKATGLVKPERGISLNVDASKVSKFGGAYKIESLPEGLKVQQIGSDPRHFEIIPAKPMATNEFQELLNHIKVSPVK